MAKRKSARPNLPEETLARARAELYGEEAIVAAPATNGSATAAMRAASPAPKRLATRYVSMEELREEYAYVLSDLRSMALLAVLLVVGMIVVSVILV